jgi:predicted dinucleotide-binding enzyme
VLVVPYGAVQSITEQYGSELLGQVVVDITNPVNWESMDRLVILPGSSAAEEIARLLPGATVVKAFNATFAGMLVEGQAADHPLEVFVAGDEADPKQRGMGIGEDVACAR